MKYTIFKKPRFCPLTQVCGHDKCTVSVGDLIIYPEPTMDDSARNRLGRVLGASDKHTLVVLQVDEFMHFAYER
ncbi:MAG: hypothetical protein Q7R45_12995, partial [Sulfuricaulis sp.]|nr:hypothetical protein [Sulfuricaulis sp.]